MNAAEGRVWLNLLVEAAPRLRDQGVTHVELGPLKFDVALVEVIQLPAATPARSVHDDDPDDAGGMNADPLDDPDTFDGKSAPGFAALRD
jgi:hypothetical protein